MGKSRTAVAEANLPSPSRLVLRILRAARGGPLETEGDIAPTVANARNAASRLMPHARETETGHTWDGAYRDGIHQGWHANLGRGIQKIYCFTKGGAKDGWSGLTQTFSTVCGISPSLGAQAGCDVPFMGTDGGGPSPRKFPYCVRRGRKGRFRRPKSSAPAELGFINQQGSRRCPGPRHGISAWGPSACVPRGEVCKNHIVESGVLKVRNIGVRAIAVLEFGPMRPRAAYRFAEI